MIVPLAFLGCDPQEQASWEEPNYADQYDKTDDQTELCMALVT